MQRSKLKSVFLLPCLLLLGVVACAVPPADGAVLDPPTAQVHEDVDRGYDVLSYGLDLSIHPTRAVLVGKVRIRLLATKALQHVELDAADMEIVSVESETPGLELLPFHSSMRLLTIPFAHAVVANTEFTLDIQYRSSSLAGMHYVLPNLDGLDHIPHVYTQGEAQRARYWFPCNDTPADRATHTLRATVPRSWVTVAAGEMVGREYTEDGFSAIDTWVMDQDMPTYLFSFAAGPFLKLEEKWQDISLWFVGEPQDLAALSASLAETAEVLGFFSDYTGFRYPFAKYAQVAVRDFPFGGMENVSATTVTRNALHAEAYQQARPSWGLVAHEAAHQWFGDIVTCVDWPHAWLNEGFASYFNLLYLRHRSGEGEFQVAMGNTIDHYLNSCKGEHLRALVKTDYRLPMDLFFDGTIYPGGAARLQLFRGILGEEKYRQALKVYLHRNAFRSVDSEALREAFDDVSGRDFAPIFADWVYSPGYPELQISWRRQGRDLEVHVLQTQRLLQGVPAAFHFPLDLRWYEDGQWRETRLQVQKEDQVFHISTGPSFDGWLEIDPHVFLPAKISVEESLTSTRLRAQKAWSSRSRVLAMRQLEMDQGQQTESLLWSIARTDKVTGVRLEAVRQLRRRLNKTADIARLRASYAAERDAQVRAAWWLWISAYAEDPIVAQLLRETLASADALTGLRVTALHALAQIMDASARLQFAKSWLQKDAGEGERIHLAALQVLASLEMEGQQSPLATEALRTLLPWSWKGHSTPIRAAALTHLSHWLKSIPQQNLGATDLALVDTFRKGLQSLSAPLRRAAAAGVSKRPEFFTVEIDNLLRRDPDARIRRLLEVARNANSAAQVPVH